METRTSTGGPVDTFALWLAQKLDGTKTITGIILIIGGIATVFATPEFRESGIELFLAGITLLVVGVTHKQIKSERENA